MYQGSSLDSKCVWGRREGARRDAERLPVVRCPELGIVVLWGRRAIHDGRYGNGKSPAQGPTEERLCAEQRLRSQVG